ncbi:PilZ domain-containing protein [Candidatus Omnitrophota bacterium]
MWDGLERRKFPRVQYPCLVTVFKRMKPALSILTHTENLSLGGVRVVVSEQIDVAAEVDIEIDLQDMLPNVLSKGTVAWVRELTPGDPALAAKKRNIQRLKGKVAWVKKIPSTRAGEPAHFDIGIQFVGLKADDRHRVERIVAYFAGKTKERG